MTNTAVLGYVSAGVCAIVAFVALTLALYRGSDSAGMSLAIGVLNVIGLVALIVGGVRLQAGRGGLNVVRLGAVAPLLAIWILVADGVVGVLAVDNKWEVTFFTGVAVLIGLVVSMLPGAVLLASRGRAIPDWLQFCAAVRARGIR